MPPHHGCWSARSFAATDFFMVEVATWHGLVTYSVLVVMDLATRPILRPRSCSNALDS
jgi:hypothetical protein